MVVMLSNSIGEIPEFTNLAKSKITISILKLSLNQKGNSSTLLFQFNTTLISISINSPLYFGFNSYKIRPAYF